MRGLDRSNPLRAAGALRLAAAAVPAARRAPARARAPRPCSAAAATSPGRPGSRRCRCGLPLVLTEADRHLGLTNRLLARRARRVCLAFPIEGRDGDALPGHRPPGAGGDRRRRPRRGARALRDRRRRPLPARLRRQPGRALDQPLRARGVRRPGGARRATSTSSTSAATATTSEARGGLDAAPNAERYTLLAYEPGLADALAASDLVLARSGGSIFEIAAAGRPAILVPYPYAAGRHQHANADWMADAGAAVVIEDAELEPDAPARARRRAARRRRAAGGDGGGVARRSRGPTPPSGSRPSCSAAIREPVLAMSADDWSGRELHFIAIGGAGMSGLALVCDAARAPGSAAPTAPRAPTCERAARRRDRAARRPRRRRRARRAPRSSSRPRSRDDNPELARARERGQRVLHRGELLAELCALQRLIAVAGHPRQDDDRRDAGRTRCARPAPTPRFFLGGELPGAGPDGDAANAGWGAGEWVVAEADESDGSFLELAPEIAVVTNVELDHHSRWGSRAELTDAFARFAAAGRGRPRPARRRRARSDRRGGRGPGGRASTTAGPGPARLELAGPGPPQRAQRARGAGGARARRRSSSSPRPRRSRRFPGIAAPPGAQGQPRRGRDLRRLRPPPDRGRGDAGGAARARAAAADRASSSRTCTRARRRSPSASAPRSPPPTRSACSTSTRPASSRSGELAGVSGLDVARAAADRAGGRPVLVAPRRARPPSARSPARLRRGRPAGHDRRRRRVQGRPRHWWRSA